MVKDRLGFTMPFDAQSIFANLAEKERIRGHHSPEGRAIRTLSRALSGWASGSLAHRDVVVLCDQAVEDWLKARLRRSPWSMQSVPALLPDALAHHWVTPSDADRYGACTIYVREPANPGRSPLRKSKPRLSFAST